MRAAVAIKPTAVDIVAEFDTVTTRKDYGKALAAIGDSGRFTDDERGDIARAMARCWGRVAMTLDTYRKQVVAAQRESGRA